MTIRICGHGLLAKRMSSSCPVTIVEGMTPTFLEADLLELSLFFYTDAETELDRRRIRDTLHRGRKAEVIQQTHAHRRDSANSIQRAIKMCLRSSSINQQMPFG